MTRKGLICCKTKQPTKSCKTSYYYTLLSTLGQSGPGSDGNKGVPSTHQSSSITEASLSDCLVSYAGRLFFTPLQRSNRCILQLPLTGPEEKKFTLVWHSDPENKGVISINYWSPVRNMLIARPIKNKSTPKTS